MSVPFTPEQALAMRLNQFSSTAREITGFYTALKELHRSGALATTHHVQIWTDSLDAQTACVNMRGANPVFAAVKQLYLLAWDNDIMLEFVWVPRSHELLRYADFMSKLPDPTDWCFSRTFATHLVFHTIERTPDIDCLASSTAHMCPFYYSLVYDGSCAAVDGFRQPWNTWPDIGNGVTSSRPGKPLCWVFPPPSLALTAARKIQAERADAILVIPRDTPAALVHILSSMTNTAARTREIMLTGPHQKMVFPSSRVPPRAADGGWKTPLKAFVVTWGQ
jgi:hypothetical protein